MAALHAVSFEYDDLLFPANVELWGFKASTEILTFKGSVLHLYFIRLLAQQKTAYLALCSQPPAKTGIPDGTSLSFEDNNFNLTCRVFVPPCDITKGRVSELVLLSESN